MNRGYIKLWRSSVDNPLYFTQPFTKWQAWTDLLLLANHKPNTVDVRGIGVHLDRGQVLAGEEYLATRWKWSRNKVRRFLSHLSSKTIQQIEQQKNNVCSVLTILNWNTYQSNGTANETPDDTTERQQKVQQKDTPKNDKNDKNEKEATQGELLIGVSNEQEMSRQGIISRWNAIAKPLGISCISTVTDDRMRRFKAKIKTFPDFWAVVESESKLLDDYVFQKGWFGFDFLIKGDGYVKFKEGKYRKKGIKPDNGLEMYLPDSRPLNEQELEWSRLYGQKTKAAT